MKYILMAFEWYRVRINKWYGISSDPEVKYARKVEEEP